MSWGDAHRLTLILLTDTSSQLCAAVRGWVHPITREDMVLRDSVDGFNKVNFKRPDPYPRPWHPQPKRIGGANVTAAEFQAMKAAIAAQN